MPARLAHPHAIARAASPGVPRPSLMSTMKAPDSEAAASSITWRTVGAGEPPTTRQEPPMAAISTDRDTQPRTRRRNLRFGLALSLTALVAPAGAQTATPGHRGPGTVALSPEGLLWVLCQSADTIVVVDPQTRRVLHEWAVEAMPWAVAWHPDEAIAYVTCRTADAVLEIDRQTGEIQDRFELRGGPTGVAVSADGSLLYVGLHLLDRIATIRISPYMRYERHWLLAGNAPEFLRPSPGGGVILASHLLSNPHAPDEPPVMEVSVIGSTDGRIVRRHMVVGANAGRDVAFAPDGSFALLAHVRPKNLVPLVQVARGWTSTNAVLFIDLSGDEPPVSLLIDTPNHAYPDPFGVAISPDGGKAYVTSSGADTVTVIDVPALLRVVEEVRMNAHPDHADDLGLSRRFVRGRIPVGTDPRGLAFGPEGRYLFVANRLDDTLSVIDTRSDTVVDTIPLGPPPRKTALWEGDRLFHTGEYGFQRGLGCASCHPDEAFDGLVYDLEPDGLGIDLVENRSLRGLRGTQPFKWNGKNPDLATQCGGRAAKWIFRTDGMPARDVVKLTIFIKSLQPFPNPYRQPELTPAQARGKAVFERTHTNTGRLIPVRARCTSCHPPPLYTNHQRADVGTRRPNDRTNLFDAAHLMNIFETAPYLHDGSAATLEEIFTIHNRHDLHGITSDLTKEQLNDLIEFLKCL